MSKKLHGLTSAEVEDRKKRDLTNKTPNQSSRRVVDILRANLLTRFNILILALAVIVFVVSKSPYDVLFGVVIVVNAGIGIFQELRAKRMLDKLAILNAATVAVIRDSKTETIAVSEIVQDDLIKLKLGDQIVADGTILDSSELEIDESLLTGESDPIVKTDGEKVLSGAIVVAGAGVMRAEKVGVESYSYQLTLKAKKFQRAKSELLDGTNKLLKWISLMLIVVAPIIVWGQLRIDYNNWREAIVYATAAVVGMIPEG
ncbi:MAG: HAD-IC family P-type ATPase, partial [Candidatus Nomurabacteria bacterium]|nr:HAD-IC family P-type ATPase [Candidatus Nomurabacteria bacterium]